VIALDAYEAGGATVIHEVGHAVNYENHRGDSDVKTRKDANDAENALPGHKKLSDWARDAFSGECKRCRWKCRPGFLLEYIDNGFETSGQSPW